jgi:hypothetical protein
MFKEWYCWNYSPRDFAVQYATDNTDIEEYLKHIITVSDNPFSDDQDVVFTKIPVEELKLR